MDLTADLGYGAFSFARHIIGIVTKPYETYRTITSSGSVWELPYLGVLVGIYFAFATLVKVEAFRIFLLTKQFVMLFGAAASMYLFVVSLLWYVGQRFGGTGSLKAVFLGWAYTLVPTMCWFLVTSFLYVLLPPPRTTSALGTLFSVVYLVFSGSLFFWKVVLVYLTLRFGQKMALSNIIKTISIVLPAVILYSLFLYRMGIFRIPFI